MVMLATKIQRSLDDPSEMTISQFESICQFYIDRYHWLNLYVTTDIYDKIYILDDELCHCPLVYNYDPTHIGKRWTIGNSKYKDFSKAKLNRELQFMTDNQ